LIVGDITFLPGPSSSTDGPGEDLRSQCLKEIQRLEQALDFYRDRMTSYNEEELEEERQTFFTKIIEMMQNDTVLEDTEPRFMPPRAKKARGGPYESKAELLIPMNQTTRMYIGTAASRDPDMQAACAYATQRADAVQLQPLQQFGELLSACSDEQFEKIISICSSTNNLMKFDYITKACFKQVFEMVQLREMQNTNIKLAMNSLTQQMVTGAFAAENGVVNWSGEGNSLQMYSSAVLKEKCRRTGAAEADAARGAMPM
jgi:hypothetical protein